MFFLLSLFAEGVRDIEKDFKRYRCDDRRADRFDRWLWDFHADQWLPDRGFSKRGDGEQSAGAA